MRQLHCNFSILVPFEMSLNVNSQDVVRMILQYLKENNLNTSLRALQLETGVCMNIVENVEVFVNNIINGKWDNVLAIVSTLQLPQDKLISVVFHSLY